MKQNSLKINRDKTEYIIFSSKPDHYKHISLTVGREIVHPSKQGGSNRGGGLGGSQLPLNFGWGGLNTCQPPLILRKNFLRGVGSP